jgi:membrane associated rhomboid family serine protease
MVGPATAPAQVGGGLLSALLTALFLAVLVGSLAVVTRLAGYRGGVAAKLRSRLVMGVPWGTLVSVGVVLAVYLFVQGGWSHWGDPVVTPFRAWSFLYPTGIVTSGFAHSGPGHLIGNLVGTVVLAPICEYAWGHFPRERGSASFASWRTNPWIRALVIFPAGTVVLGLATGVFAAGPVIGFSGVVFAYAGFALVTRPITALVGALGVQSLVRLAYVSLRDPIVTANPQPSPPTAPWWADVAIQGHAIGLLLGVLAAATLLYRRGETPDAGRVYLAALLFAVEQNLWAIYWYLGEEKFVLFQGPGLVAIALLALLVTVGVASSLRDRYDQPIGVVDSSGFSTRSAAFVALLLVFAPIAGLGVGANAFAASPADPPANATVVDARDYEVYYAEDVTNEMVAVVDVEAFGLTTKFSSSGVIVASERRGIWTQRVSKGQLAFLGTTTVTVGGVGWREEVRVRRDGWNAVGGGTAYKVFVGPVGGEEQLSYVSESAQAEPRIAGYNVSVVPVSEGGFAIAVTQNGSVVDDAFVPAKGENVTLAGITFEREGRTVYATTPDGTRVPVLREEQYRNA